MLLTKSDSNKSALELITKDRKRTNLLMKHEQKALAYLVQRIPMWITSDMLTGIGLVGNIIVLISLILAKYIAVPYLLIGIAGFAISWFGDSLDGRIAYYRKKSRKWYGFALDITVDWLGILLIGLGFIIYADGIMELCGYGFVVLYGWEMLTAMLRYKITGIYTIDSGSFGPTEVRIVLALIFVLEVLFIGSILYISLAITVLLFIMNIIDTKKLLKLADARDLDEKK